MNSPGRRLQITRFREKGATMVEFAFSLTVILFILLAGFEALRLCYLSVTLQYLAAWSLRRAIVTDNAAPIQTSVMARGSAFGISLTDTDVRICPLSNLSCTTDSVGDPGELIAIRISREADMLLWMWQTNRLGIEGFAVGKNELR